MNRKSLIVFNIVITFLIIAIPLFIFKDFIITFIKENIIVSVLINLIITTLITGYFKLIFDKLKIKYEVSKQIELELESEPIRNRLSEFESELNKSKEIYLKEYEKNITGFNKFIDKKYEVYPILLAELQKTQEAIYSNWENQIFSNLLKNYTTEHFSGLLDLFFFSIPDKCSLIEKHKLGTIEDIDFYELFPGHIRVCITNANNSYQINRIFLSKNVDKIVNEIILHFNEAWSGYFGFYNKFSKKPEAGEKIKPAYEKSGEKIVQLVKLMREELEHKMA